MRINNVVGITSSNVSRNIAFTRAPKKGTEERQYNRAIQTALDYLGIQNLSMIIHGPSFPAQDGFDTKCGSPLGNNDFVEFAQLHGFNAIQLGPNGKLNKGETSPYTSSVFEKNPLFINFNSLTQPEYASILSSRDIANNTHRPQAKSSGYTRVDYDEATKSADILMDIAYAKFSEKLSAGDKEAQKLNAEFSQFKRNNQGWLPYYGVANVLSEKYGTDFYPNWSKEDQELISKAKKGNKEAKAKFLSVAAENKAQIDKYVFTQFIVDKQTKEDAKGHVNFSYISDLEVGVSSLDELIYQDVFLQDYRMGCPEGKKENPHQLWGFKVVDPNKLFEKDGKTLGPSGLFIKDKLQNCLSGSKNVRVDHVFGLINPWVYRPDSVKTKTVMIDGKPTQVQDKEKIVYTRMCKSEIDEDGNFKKYVPSEIDPKGNFRRILPDIFLPTMIEMGVDPKSAVWEDLGHDETGVSKKIITELGIPGIKCTKWSKAKDSRNFPNHTTYVGCHDNASVRNLLEKGFEDKKHARYFEPNYLAEELVCDDYKGPERDSVRHQLLSSPQQNAKGKFSELFYSTKNIQVSFMDFFGLDQSYNVPGTTGNHNWTLRLSPNYKEAYYKSLAQQDGWAINMPEVLSKAVRAKMHDEVSSGKIWWEDAENQVYPITLELNKWANVLKEKE